MARTIRNAGSAPIYRETENLMLLCIEMVERTPNSVGIRQLSKRLIDTLLDGLTVIGLALNEEDPDSKLELINSFYLQMRTVKTCIDTLKEWSNRSPHTRIISNKQMLEKQSVGAADLLNGYDYDNRDIFIEKWACHWAFTKR